MAAQVPASAGLGLSALTTKRPACRDHPPAEGLEGRLGTPSEAVRRTARPGAFSGSPTSRRPYSVPTPGSWTLRPRSWSRP